MNQRDRPARPDPIRKKACEVLQAVEGGTFLHDALEKARRGSAAGSPGVARLTRLTTGVVKWRDRLDYEIDQRMSRPDRLPPAGRIILRLALFELRHADTPDHAVVNDAVELMRTRGLEGLTGLINGVLRRAVRTPEPEPGPEEDDLQRMAVRGSHPRWLLERIIHLFGRREAEGYIEWNNQPPPLWVRVDCSRLDLVEARQRLARAGIMATGEGPVPGYLRLAPGTIPGQLAGVHEGWLTVQDPSAALAVWAVGKRPGGSVLDLCAAPGGKATHLAEHLGPGAVVAATDADPQRRQRLLENVHRHGGRVQVVEWSELMASTRGFDAVLVDAPCSNLGVLRRRADARWRIGPGEPARLAQLQYRLLERGAERLSPHGVLTYSTCTLLPEENEEVVACFLERHTEFVASTLPDEVPARFRQADHMAASHPWEHCLDGAFVARLTRLTEG